LVRDDAQLVPGAREMENGLEEIVTEFAIDPSRAQNHVAAQAVSDRFFAGELSPPVDIDRAGGVGFGVGAWFGALKQVASRSMEERGASRGASLSQQGRSQLVALAGRIEVGFGKIDLGIASRID